MTGMENVLAMIEDIVHAETGQHVFRSGWDGSFTPAAGTLAETLEAAGFGNLHDAWAEGAVTALCKTLIQNPYPAPKVSES